MNSNSTKAKFEDVIKDLKTKSDKIRALSNSGYTRTEISKLLDIRYQHVRKVLIDSGITSGLKNCKAINEVSATETRRKSIEPVSWEVLLKAGFDYVGDWLIENDKLRIDGLVPRKQGIYAIIVDDKVVYIGLTLNGLNKRMDQYRIGHKGQRTSARINQLVIDSLRKGMRVKVLVCSPDNLEWNGLPVNTSAGLEAGLIKLFCPQWNIQGAKI